MGFDVGELTLAAEVNGTDADDEGLGSALELALAELAGGAEAGELAGPAAEAAAGPDEATLTARVPVLVHAAVDARAAAAVVSSTRRA